MSELYRPSNGSEGMDFMARFCDRCTKDRDYDNPCEILGRTLGLMTQDPNYPREWIQDDDGANPRCTAFERVPEKQS